MTPDSLSQYAQIMGTEPLVNHHPWFHTMLIAMVIKPAYAICGDVYFSIACFTVFQILLVSLSIGYCIECIYEFGFCRKIRVTLLLCFILLPYNLIYAVTIWKDIIFSMAVLVLTITIIRMWKECHTRDMILFIICGILMCLVRHNGFYAFAATAAIILILKRKAIKRYLLCIVSILLVAILCRGPLPDALGIESDQFVYNLPIVLQQIGRVVVDELPISTDEEEMLSKINSLDYIKAGYSNQGADSMTAWVLSGDYDYFNEHISDYLGLWLRLGIRYPRTYFRAYIDITMGYWSPMQPQQTVFFGITEYGTGLHTQSPIKGSVLIKVNELLYKLYTMIPVYGFMYCMGGYFWILIMLAAICVLRRDNPTTSPTFICMVPVFLLSCTLFVATPLVADLRYSYALMITLPYIWVAVLKED